MKFLFASVLVIAVYCAAVLANVKFRSCGPAAVKKIIVDGSDNKATPTLQRGKTYTIKAEYISGAAHSSLKTHFFAILNGATVKWEDVYLRDGCETIKPGCPVQKGRTYSYFEDISIPRTATPMRTVVKIKQDGENNAEHLCVIFSILIK